MNAYGLRSINTDTFNLKWHINYMYPQQTRNALVTFLKVPHLTLNILGYIPGVSVYNVGKELSAASVCTGCMQYAYHGPYPDPEYSFPFWLLDLA
jgi:hypothetical protein